LEYKCKLLNTLEVISNGFAVLAYGDTAFR
jgi:hypothetical protein